MWSTATTQAEALWHTTPYDAWGNVLAVKDESGKRVTDTSHIGNINPIRYRGYYYDVESGLYYLNSRYYDAEVGRFISADGYISTGQGVMSHNMFAYCNNNPVRYIDSSGCLPDDILLKNAELYAAGNNILMCGEANNRKKEDITEKLNEAMKGNADILSDYKKQNSYVETISFFVDKVKPGGDWDFKSQDEWALDPNTIYLYNDTRLRFDDIGNIHYGYVGRVIFSENVLCTAGGIVQIGTRTSKFSYWNSNFDDPRDQWAIQFGCNLWDTEVLS